MRANKGLKTKSWDGPDRRKYPRFEYPFYMSHEKRGKKLMEEILKPSDPFYFREKKREELTISHNISIGGICFVTKEKFLPRASLLVKLWSPVTNKILVGVVQVRWQKPISFSTKYLTGVAFISLNDKEELKELLEAFTDLKLEEMILK